MPRATRSSTSGPLESLPYGPIRKRKGSSVAKEEERVPVTEKESATTGRRGNRLGELEVVAQEIAEFNVPKVSPHDNRSALPSRPRKRARAITPEAQSDDVVEVAASARKTAEPATKLDKTKGGTGTSGPRRSPRKSLIRDNAGDTVQKTAAKPHLSVQSRRNRSSLTSMDAKEKELTEETERRIEGMPSEDEEGGGARLSASHDPLQLKGKQPASRRTTRSSLRIEQVPSDSDDEDGDLLPADRSQENPEKVVEELMNNVVTSAIAQLDGGEEEEEVEDAESEGDADRESNPSDGEDVDEAVRHQLPKEAGDGANNEVEVQPEPVANEENDTRRELSLVTSFKEKLEKSSEALQTFKEQLRATTDTADKLMRLRAGTHHRPGYTRILQEIIRKLAEEERPDNGALEELADFASNISNMVSGIRDAHRDVKALLEDLSTGITSGTNSVRIIETMLEQNGFKEKAPHDGINWKRINRNLEARENEVLFLAKPKPADPETPRRSARSNLSRYRTQGTLPTPEARPPPSPPAIPPPPPRDSLSDLESLDVTAPVIGDDAPVEVVRIESFGSRPSNTPRRSERRRENDDDDSPRVREDRAWSSPELKALFRRLTQVQKAEPGKIIVLDSQSGYPRTKEEILTKAKEIKGDMMRSGRAGSLKPTWDNI
ncbi:hypothetical protein L873DRAFT_1790818 [Choiromyces venosus 120613-1]|uniref:Uncharacterized protein n=1 Tax=Choiromyces venosus 120613-1 TaxID=1336337 RepID=A0A3N4JHB2_9PEZI|nr:hypothetical protein L873DRAFT_1790818 [Choiromyces venosus 120613-1]